MQLFLDIFNGILFMLIILMVYGFIVWASMWLHILAAIIFPRKSNNLP